jgi:hypothetical protein
LKRFTSASGAASRNSSRYGTPPRSSESSTLAMPSNDSPLRTSETTAARSTWLPSWPNSSASEPIISGGRLSTQK